MTSFYRGKRVSDYRKQYHADAGPMVIGTARKFDLNVGATDRIRAIKNLRGLVTIAGGDSSPYNNRCAGHIHLFRCPSGDYPSGPPNIEASALLHPVPFAMYGAPLTIAWEFRGITMAPGEECWFSVYASSQSGTVNVGISLLWAQKDSLTPP